MVTILWIWLALNAGFLFGVWWASMRTNDWVCFLCPTCKGYGDVDPRTYAKGAVTLQFLHRGEDGHYANGVPCRDCDGTGKRWRPRGGG